MRYSCFIFEQMLRVVLSLYWFISLGMGLLGQGDKSNIVRDLTITLIDSTQGDRDRLDAIYQYVIHNISYDSRAYKGRQRRINRNSVDVLRRKKAVCWGYAELIREMCDYAGIPSFTVVGYSKELPFPARSLENANHAWNAVQLDGQWYLLDATWDSGLLSGADYFTTQYEQDYYLTPPELFIKNHLPIMPMWQLLECPVKIRKWKKDRFKTKQGCDYKFNEMIDEYMSMSKIEQMGREVEVAYELNETAKNKSLMGHGLVDIAYEKKEKGDALLESGEPFKAMEELKAALDLFELAQTHCEFYDWQEEGYVFTAINLCQAYYQEFYEDRDRSGFLKEHFEKTRDIISAANLKKMVKDHALDLLNEYISVLN